MTFTNALISITYKSLVVFLFLCYFQSEAQDSLATVYFYHAEKFTGSVPGFNINDGEKMIGVIRSSSAFKYRCGPGLHTFKAKTQTEASFKLVTERGKTYFVECGLAVGLGVGRPSFRLASSADGSKSLSKIDTAAYDKTPFIVVETTPSADTIKALQHLYERKRKGGTTRAVVFTFLGTAALVNTLNYKSPTVQVNSGTSIQYVPINDSPPVGDYVGIGVFTIVAITGFTQIRTYSIENLKALLKDYNNGLPLPKVIKSKLKEKDFKVAMK